jgi:hypothetical protein
MSNINEPAPGEDQAEDLFANMGAADGEDFFNNDQDAQPDL